VRSEVRRRQTSLPFAARRALQAGSTAKPMCQVTRSRTREPARSSSIIPAPAHNPLLSTRCERHSLAFAVPRDRIRAFAPSPATSGRHGMGGGTAHGSGRRHAERTGNPLLPAASRANPPCRGIRDNPQAVKTRLLDDAVHYDERAANGDRVAEELAASTPDR
jgi:hypothetical protein